MRLIDADALREDWLEKGMNEPIYTTNDFLNSIDDAPTVLIATLLSKYEPIKVTGDHKCPRCYSPVKSLWCVNCGQALDWSGQATE